MKLPGMMLMPWRNQTHPMSRNKTPKTFNAIRMGITIADGITIPDGITMPDGIALLAGISLSKIALSSAF
jgi:hypothetical protein